jgi:hypothetical protein
MPARVVGERLAMPPTLRAVVTVCIASALEVKRMPR